MLKRVMVIAMLVISLVVMVGTRAEAGLYNIGGISVTGTHSIKVASILQGLRNVSKVPVGYEVVVFLQTVTVICTNPAGHSDPAQGVPFDQVVSLTSVQTDQAFKISKNGRALSDITFENTDLRRALSAAGVLNPAGVCRRNFNLEKLIVNSLQVFGTLFADTDPTNNCNVNDPRATGCTIEDALGLQCSAPTNQDLSDDFTYICTTICPTGTRDCPQPPVELELP